MSDVEPLTAFAAINPQTKIILDPGSMVSFIPMADATESGAWVGQQIRSLREVDFGYTCFREGDVLFAKITPCMENGKGAHAVGLTNGVGFGSTEFHVVRAKPGVDARWLFHVCQSARARNAAVAFMGGSAGQQRVSSEFFASFRVASVSPGEQRRIAAVLDTLDAAIEAGRRRAASLVTLGIGIKQELFRDEGAALPARWESALLKEVVPTIDYGISTSLSTSGEVPVLRMMNLCEGEAVLDDLKYADSKAVGGLTLRPGDVLFNRTNSIEHVGRTGIWRAQLGVASFASYLVRLNVNQNRVLPEYLNGWLNQPSTLRGLRRYATPGVQQVNVNPTNLRRISIQFPSSLREQERIVRAVSDHREAVNAVRTDIQKLEKAKRGVTEDLLTGRVRTHHLPADLFAP
jgi:type I restriction enzyme S subunit